LVLTSRKDAAKRLKKFVTAKVLPSIRKTGSYGTPAPAGITAAMLKSDPRLMMEMLLHNTQRVIELEETTKTLEAEKETMAEDVKAFEVLTRSDGSLTITDAAKDLHVKRVALIEWLKTNAWIYRRLGNAEWVGYHVMEKAGLVDHVMQTYRTRSGGDHCCSQVRITPKGLKELALIVSNIRARV
jgi:phage antirepressor YoqD-like protein